MASPENTKLVESLRAAALLRGDDTIAQQRQRLEQSMDRMPVPEGVRFEAASGLSVPAEWVRLGTPTSACVLYLHGGGFALGSPRSHRPLLGNLVKASGIDLLAIDYRLAPEHPYPAALEDTLAAYRWLLSTGYPPARIGVAGDSAGGGLTLSAMMAMRRERLPLPGCGVLLCGWLDLTLSGPSWKRNAAADPFASGEMVKPMVAAYVGRTPATDPGVSPVFGDFSGLPPLLVQAGTADSIEDDSHLCVRRAQEAGVDATLDLWVDMVHVWQFYAHMLPEAEAAITKIASYLTSRLR
jgi:monoterpene epsilon-lactone hydrolase